MNAATQQAEALRDHARFLSLELASFQHRPELHRHQLAAVARYLALAESSSSLSQYMANAGDLFELARAAWLDRYFNEASACYALGDWRAQHAALICYRAGLDATDFRDFSAALVAAKEHARALGQRAEICAAALPRLLDALRECTVEMETKARTSQLELVAAYWQLMVDNDNGMCWQRICDSRFYRQRIPFGDDAMATLGEGLRRAGCEAPAETTDATQAVDDTAADAAHVDIAQRAADYVNRMGNAAQVATSSAQANDAFAIPTAASAAYAYHVACDALERDDDAAAGVCAVYDELFQLESCARDAPALLLAMAQHNILLRIAVAPRLFHARRGLTMAENLKQPHLSHHFRELVTALEDSRSVTELEHRISWLDRCLEIETSWTDILLGYATRALRAALAWEADRSDERRQTVVKSYRYVAEIFGLSWHDLMHTPLIHDFVDIILVPATSLPQLADGDDDSESPEPSWFGDVSPAAIAELRASAAERLTAAAERGAVDTPAKFAAFSASRFANANRLIDHATQLFNRALAGGDAYVPLGPSSGRVLQLWGHAIALANAGDAIASPTRPTSG